MADETQPQVKVEGGVETINTSSAVDLFAHPAVIWLVAFVTIGVLGGFGWVTWAVLTAPSTEAGKVIVNGVDPATKGAIIQTWNNLAVAAAAVWTTSSVVNRLKGTHA
jgi:hypothetical protein